MYTVDSGTSLHMMDESSPYCAGVTTTTGHLEIQSESGIVRSTKEAKVFIQELCLHLPVREVDGRFSFVIVACDELGYSYSWQSGEYSNSSKG